MFDASKERKIGSIISYVQMAVNVIVGLLYTPIMIRLLGQSEYGLYNTVSSTVSVLSVLSLGFNSSYIRFYSKYKKDNDYGSIYKLNGLFLLVFLVIGFIALLCGTFLSFNLNLVFSVGLTSHEYEIARILMLMLTINLAVSFPMSVFSNIISAHERFIFLKLISVLKTIFSPLVSLPLLLMGYRSVALVAITVTVNLITDVIYFIYVVFILKNRFVFHAFEKGLLRTIFVFTSFIAIELIVDQVNWNIDKILLGRFWGTQLVAVYSVGASLYTYYQSFSTAISGLFAPMVHQIYNRNSDDEKNANIELTGIFIRVGRVQFLILSLVASGLVIFGRVFIQYWAGPEYYEAYYVTLLLVLPATIALIQNVGIEIQRAKNKHQFRSIVYVVMAFVNLILSIFLCQTYGATGAAIGTAFSLIVANGLIMNIYYRKVCGIDVTSFWNNIMKLSKGLIVPIIVGVFIQKIWQVTSIWVLLVQISIYTTVYCLSMWLFGMNETEKLLIISFLPKGRMKGK